MTTTAAAPIRTTITTNNNYNHNYNDDNNNNNNAYNSNMKLLSNRYSQSLEEISFALSADTLVFITSAKMKICKGYVFIAFGLCMCGLTRFSNFYE